MSMATTARSPESGLPWTMGSLAGDDTGSSLVGPSVAAEHAPENAAMIRVKCASGNFSFMVKPPRGPEHVRCQAESPIISAKIAIWLVAKGRFAGGGRHSALKERRVRGIRDIPMPDTLHIQKKDDVTSVVIQSLTMPPRFFDELGAAFDEISVDARVRAVILRSEAKHFSYGLDLPAAFQELGPGLSGGTASVRMELRRTISRLQEQVTKIARCPVPVIAAVHGWCIGGGVDVITACDLRLASDDAKFSVRETKIAIVADLGTLQRLPLVVGPGHARELAFTGKDVNARRAKEIALVNDVYPDREALIAGAEKLAREIADNPPLTVRGVKSVLDFGQGKSVAEGLDYVAAWNSAFLASEDLGEALSAFLEKRPPNFRGE